MFGCKPSVHSAFVSSKLSMFAPEVPEYSLSLQYRYDKDGSWTAWNNISESMGFTKSSKVYYMEQSISSGLAVDIGRNMYFDGEERKLDIVLKSTDYNKALYYAIRLHNLHYPERLQEHIQIRLQFHFTPELGSDDAVKTDSIEFPIYTIPADVR
ncbi:MAG: hypothetical protein R2809_05100 [Flavobacteriales bacterium]